MGDISEYQDKSISKNEVEKQPVLNPPEAFKRYTRAMNHYDNLVGRELQEKVEYENRVYIRTSFQDKIGADIWERSGLDKKFKVEDWQKPALGILLAAIGCYSEMSDVEKSQVKITTVDMHYPILENPETEAGKHFNTLASVYKGKAWVACAKRDNSFFENLIKPFMSTDALLRKQDDNVNKFFSPLQSAIEKVYSS